MKYCQYCKEFQIVCLEVSLFRFNDFFLLISFSIKLFLMKMNISFELHQLNINYKNFLFYFMQNINFYLIIFKSFLNKYKCI